MIYHKSQAPGNFSHMKGRSFMNAFDTMTARRSVREYSQKKVEQEKLDIILSAARCAPTAANLQPVRLIAVREKEGLERIGKAANIYGAPLAIIACADTARACKRPCDGKSTSDIDAAILTCHMMIAAASIGLDSVWICWFDPAVVRVEFNIPDSLEPVNILAVGYPKCDAPLPPTSRIPLNELVHYEKF